LINIGVYSQQTCLDFGLTGVMARCTGIKRDIRLSRTETYANYYYLNFRSYVGQHGDCFDRFLIRMNEMGESLNIINQNINKISKFNFNITNNKYLSNLDLSNNSKLNKTNAKNYIKPQFILNYLTKLNKNNNYNSMEVLINHFKF
jgi:NADH:ubiquinone oxidoreductase subunit D